MNLRSPVVAAIAAAAAFAAVPVTSATAASATLLPHVVAPAHREVPFTTASVTDNRTGTYAISWAAVGARRVRVYTGPDQNHLNRLVAIGGASSTTTVAVATAASSARQWFRLVPDQGRQIIIADRLVRLSGTTNLRDVGGYATGDGHWVQMGRVYRSDALGSLTDADIAKLVQLGITTDIDFRTDSERAAAPDKTWSGLTYVSANVLGASSLSFTLKDAATSAAFMEQGERQMVTSASAQKAYATTFATIAAAKGAVLYHCSAGKDRTGWASAVLLKSLGVADSDIMADYLLSNTYRADVNAATLAAMPAAAAAAYKPLLDVRPEYLQAGADELYADYGSLDNYLITALGFTRPEYAAIRAKMLG